MSRESNITSSGRGGVRTVRSSDTRTGSPATTVTTKAWDANATPNAKAEAANAKAWAAYATARAEIRAETAKADAAQAKAAKAKAAKAEVKAWAVYAAARAKTSAGSSIAASGKPGPGGEKTTPISANRGGGGGGGDQPRVPAGDPDGGQWTI